MSDEFMNTPIPQKQPETPTATDSVQSSPAPTLNDFTVIHNFRGARPEAIERINADFDLQMTSEQFTRLQMYYGTALRRDPTVGELRMLDAQARMAEHLDRTHRVAVGEFLTDSTTLAEAWADMMDKYAALHHGLGTRADAGAHILPPCTCEEALTLLGTYLRRTEEPACPRDTADMAVVTTPKKEAEAIVAGFSPVARMMTEDGQILTLVSRHGKAPAELPPHVGDLLLCAPVESLATLSTLLTYECQKRTPDIGALRLVTDSTLLSAILELAPAADLYADRLIRQADLRTKGFLPIATLCGLPSDTPTVVLRVPVRHVHQVSETWKNAGMPLLAIGRLSPGDRVVIRLRDPSDKRDDPVVILPAAMLAMPSGRYLRSYRLTASDTPAALRAPAISRLPGLWEAENGLDPNGRETVALTAAPSSVLFIPEEKARLTVVTGTITAPETAYRTGYEAVASAVTALTEASPEQERPTLTVTLTVRDRADTAAGMLPALICGLYRAAAERGLPIEDSVLLAEPSAEAPAVGLTLTAWAREKRLPAPTGRKTSPAAEPVAKERSADALQWSAGLQIRHKESPGFFFPVLRRSCEGSLRALTTALNRSRGAGCSILPLAISTVAVESPEPSVSDDTPPAVRIEQRERIHPAAAEKLSARILEWGTPIFTMGESDAHLLLSEPAICDALENRLARGGHIVVLGEACRAFAAYGYLPNALSELTVISRTDRTAEVSYRLAQAPAGPVKRLVRCDLLAPTRDTDGLLTLHLPDGRAVPDGFVGHDGLTLGLLNGLDAVLSDTLTRPFQRFYIDV